VILERRLFPFAALSGSYFAYIGVTNPFIALWFKEIGLSLWAISFWGALSSTTRVIGPFFWGHLGDATGRRVWLMRWASVLALVSSVLLLFPALGFSWPTAAVFAVLFFVFLQTSALMPMSEAALAQAVSQGGRFDATQYGRVRLFGSLGFMLAVLAAGAWFDVFGIGHFIPAWLLMLSLLLLACFWLRDPPAHEQVVHERVSVWPVLRERQTQWFFATAFFQVLAHMGIYVFFSLYCAELGYSKTMIGLLWVTGVVTEIIWFFVQGRWFARLSLKQWFMLAATTVALRMVLTATLAGQLWVLLIAQGLHAITFAASHTATTAWLAHRFAGALQSRGQALYVVLGYGVPGILGSLVFGALSTRFGLVSVFWASAVAGVVALMCASRLHHEIKVEPVATELSAEM
jgi:MFS transporter, PPP family, 3-phenylpropionic acid transporter